MNRIILATLSATLLLLPLTSQAGNLDDPGTVGSNMPTTTQIYDLLNTGTVITVPDTTTFNEPAAGPTTGARKSLSDINAKLPAPDNTNGAAASDVLTTKTFWGLRTDGTWGLNAGTLTLPTVASGSATAADVLSGVTFTSSAGAGTGSMPNKGAVSITPGTSAQTIAAGYHNGSGSVAGSAGLVSANIKSGVTIFGVAGSSTVVDTSTGTATEANLLTGKTAFVNGAMLTGSLSFDGTRATEALPSGTGISKSLDGNHSDQNSGTAPDTETVEIRQILGGVTTNTLGQIIGAPSNYYYSDSAGTVYSADVAYPASLSALLGTPTIDPFTGLPLTGSNTYSPGWFESPGGIYRFTTNAPLALRARSVMSELLKYRNAPTMPSAPVAKTGQTTSYAANDDGALQKGVAWPTPRFTDNLNGTVTDNLTGLIWLQNAYCANTLRNYSATALSDVTQLSTNGTMNGNNCGDSSNAGGHQTDWRLPNVRELQSLIDYSQRGLPIGHPFANVQSIYYWTSTAYALSISDPGANAWLVSLSMGITLPAGILTISGPQGFSVLPVRGGQ